MTETPDPFDLRNWPVSELLAAVRAAGILWQSTGGDDRYEVLTEGQRDLLNWAASSRLAEPAAGQKASTGTLTLAEAGAVSEILDAAGRGSYVAEAKPRQPHTLAHGRARRIGNDHLDPAATSTADVRDLLLYVDVEGYGECGWPLRDLIPGYLSGWFVVDFDLAAYYEAVKGGQAGEGWPPLAAQRVPSALWQPEHPAGHAPYCVSPAHSLGVYCSASPSEPATLHGQPSQAWHRDHPAAV